MFDKLVRHPLYSDIRVLGYQSKNIAVQLFLLILAFPLHATELPQMLNVPGGIQIIEVGDGNEPAPRVYYKDKRVLVKKTGGHWMALVGIPLDAETGQHVIEIRRADKISQLEFTVLDKEYPAQYITLKNKRMVNPKPEDLRRIKADRIPIAKALATWSEKSDIDLDFITPVDGRLSSLFGLRRFFNNQPRNPHSGLDIAAPKGTPVVAPAPGRVIETGNYYYNGNTVFLDHGQGLITGYFHMNEIKVKAGQPINRGDTLGRVGETGRVTGPHLHWNVYLNGTKVDPALFIAEDIPRLDARNKPHK